MTGRGLTKRKWVLVPLLLGMVGGGLLLTRSRWSPLLPIASARGTVADLTGSHLTASHLTASGLIEARQVSVASELGGSIAQVLVQEGGVVEVADPVIRLDTAMLDTEIAVAEAGVQMAEAGLRQAQFGARPGQIAVAEAERRQAEAAHLAAQQAVSDTAGLMATPQNLDLQIAVLRAQIEAAKARQAQASAQKDAVEVVKGAVDEAWEQYGGGGRYAFTVSEGDIEDLVEEVLPDPLAGQLPEDWADALPSLGDRRFTYGDYELELTDGSYILSVFKDISFSLDATLVPNQWWQAWVGVNAATAQVDALEANLGQLLVQRGNPQALAARHDEALALESKLAAQVEMAGTRVTALRAGLTPEELAVIEAQLGQARAGLAALVEKREMLTLTSPISGTVVDLLAREGEVAAQGAPLLTIADLADLTVTVYVPETRLGEIWLDQLVEVTVDSFPDHAFAGSVRYIADRAEFTPRNVATIEERQNLVFAVDIRLADTGGRLKPGMPADVLFVTGAGGQP